MPVTDRKALLQFLSATAKDPACITSIMEALEPLFAIADAGLWPLAALETLEAEVVAQAIASASGLEVREVHFVPSAAVFAVPAGMSDVAHRAQLWSDLWELISERFRHGGLLSELRYAAPAGTINAVFDVYQRSLGAGLARSLCPELSRRMADEITVVITAFIGFAVIGDTDRLQRLSPLIRLLPRTIPLGERTEGEPGTWLVAAA